MVQTVSICMEYSWWKNPRNNLVYRWREVYLGGVITEDITDKDKGSYGFISHKICSIYSRMGKFWFLVGMEYWPQVYILDTGHLFTEGGPGQKNIWVMSYLPHLTKYQWWVIYEDHQEKDTAKIGKAQCRSYIFQVEVLNLTNLFLVREGVEDIKMVYNADYRVLK